MGSAAQEGIEQIAVILAAGAGSRFTGNHHKLEALIGGITVLEWAVRAAHSAAIGPVVVITGAYIPQFTDPDLRVHVVHNPDWADGQATSLRTAIDAARRLGAAAAVVGLGDQPFITAASWQAVARSRSPIAVATYTNSEGNTQRSNPVRLSRDIWDDLPTSGDHGARALIQVRPDLVEAIPCQGSPADIDTLEDLRRWQNSSSTNSP